MPWRDETDESGPSERRGAIQGISPAASAATNAPTPNAAEGPIRPQSTPATTLASNAQTWSGSPAPLTFGGSRCMIAEPDERDGGLRPRPRWTGMP